MVRIRWNDSEVWTTVDGRKLPIESMAQSHARNAKNMLLRKAPKFALSEALRADMYVGMHDGGEMAHDRLMRTADEFWRASEDHKRAVDWIKRTPVFRALKRRTRKP